MNKLVIYKKKNKKIKEKNYLEIDLDDLESLSNPKHGKNFLLVPETKIGNKPFLNWFVVNDISFWWFISPVIHPKYKEITFFIDHLFEILESDTKIIRLEGVFDKIDIVKQICELKNIKLEISFKPYLVFKIKHFFKKNIKFFYYNLITKKKFKKRLRWFKSSHNFKLPSSGYTLITSPDIYRRETIDLDNNQHRDEVLLKPILNMLKINKIPKLLIDIDYSFHGSTNILTERLTEDDNWAPFEFFLDSPKSKFVKHSISILKKSIHELTSHNQKIFLHKEISLWNSIKPLFNEILFEPYLPSYLHTIEKFEYFLKKTKPKVIIQLYETGPYAKAIQISAKKLGIRTVGIQHGLIPSDYPDYIFKEVQEHTNPLGNIIPDSTLVFGNFYKKLLTETGSYPIDKVSILGHPEYLDTNKIKKITSNNFDEEYSFKDKKIILLPLVARLSTITNNAYKIILDTLYDNLKNDDDYIILIRPHPGDRLTQEYLQQLYPAKNFIASKASLIVDILSSNLIVTIMGSTVSTEAVLFEKPVLLVNLSNNINEIDVVSSEMLKKKVAHLVSLDKLIVKLKQILETFNESNVQNRQDFLIDFFNLGEELDLKKLIYR